MWWACLFHPQRPDPSQIPDRRFAVVRGKHFETAPFRVLAPACSLVPPASGGHRERRAPSISAACRRRRCRRQRGATRGRARLSDAAGAPDRRLYARRRDRHPGAPDRPMAVGAARPAIRHREPAGRRQQYRHRGGRACARRRLHAAPGRSGQRHQRHALRPAQFQLHPRHRAGRRPHPRGQRHGGEPIGSGQDASRVHRLRQGQPGQDQHGVGRHRQPAARRRRAVQDDGRHRHGARALSRRRAGADRSARRAGAALLRHHGVDHRATSGPASCARWR